MEETRNKTEMPKTKVFNVVYYHGRLADEVTVSAIRYHYSA